MHIHTLKQFFSPIGIIHRKIFCATLTGKGFYSVSPLQTNVAKGCTELSEINLMSEDESSETQCRPVLQKIRQISDITKYCPNSTWIRVSLNII